MNKLLLITNATLGIASNSERTSRKERVAARGVVLRPNGQVYLLKMNAQQYHKLPGGGVDPGEELEKALARELREEIGTQAKILAEVGIVEEDRDYDEWNVFQTSYCWLLEQYGQESEPAFEQAEIDEGAEIVIAKDIDHAIKLLEADKPLDIEGRGIQLRDLTLLREAKKILLSL